MLLRSSHPVRWHGIAPLLFTPLQGRISVSQFCTDLVSFYEWRIITEDSGVCWMLTVRKNGLEEHTHVTSIDDVLRGPTCCGKKGPEGRFHSWINNHAATPSKHVYHACYLHVVTIWIVELYFGFVVFTSSWVGCSSFRNLHKFLFSLATNIQTVLRYLSPVFRTTARRNWTGSAAKKIHYGWHPREWEGGG